MRSPRLPWVAVDHGMFFHGLWPRVGPSSWKARESLLHVKEGKSLMVSDAVKCGWWCGEAALRSPGLLWVEMIHGICL